MRLPLLPDDPRPLVFAHRGLSSLAPENTMAAFIMAGDLGFPGIELDIHLTADCQLAVIHDFFTGRTSGGAKGEGLEIEASTWTELRGIDVGSWKGPGFSGERIPSLEELFEELGDTVYYDIELKNGLKTDYGLEAAAARAIAGSRAAGRCLVSSFNPVSIARFKSLSPGVPTAIIWSGGPGVPALLRHGEGRWIGRADVLKPRMDKVRPTSAFRWRAIEAYPVLPWTVDEAAEAARLLGLGVEGLISNRPQDLGLPHGGNKER